MDSIDDQQIYDKWLERGQILELTGQELMEFVEKKTNEDVQRHERRLEREGKKRKEDLDRE